MGDWGGRRDEVEIGWKSGMSHLVDRERMV